MTMKNPPHPGVVVLQECIEPSGLTITRAAAALGVTRNTLSELVNAKRGISPEMAVRLAKVFGGTEQGWLIQPGAVRSCPSSPRPNQVEAPKGRLGACVPKRVLFGTSVANVPIGGSASASSFPIQLPCP